MKIIAWLLLHDWQYFNVTFTHFVPALRWQKLGNLQTVPETCSVMFPFSVDSVMFTSVAALFWLFIFICDTRSFALKKCLWMQSDSTRWRSKATCLVRLNRTAFKGVFQEVILQLLFHDTQFSYSVKQNQSDVYAATQAMQFDLKSQQSYLEISFHVNAVFLNE